VHEPRYRQREQHTTNQELGEAEAPACERVQY